MSRLSGVPATFTAAATALLAAILVATLVGCSTAADDGAAEQNAPGPANSPAAPTGESADQFAGSGFDPCPVPGTVDGSAAAGSTGDKLPDLRLPCMDGSGEVALAGTTGLPRVLNLWASWCPPCREELPAFQRLAADGVDRVTVVGVVTSDAAGTAVDSARELGLSFANMYDRQAALSRSLGRSALPLSVFVRADGTIAHIYAGQALSDLALRDLVAEQLGVDLR